MGDGYAGGSSFAFIIVVFVLLVIVGCACFSGY
ncbi:YjcZ family sporulation protein [Peribacillus glennii]|uniref:YjcZ family sporulation protein n=1 Tax=Peribacillus glennii TaxID=2303991 RepID=A0A372LFZ2_9BACI|nr:YjcZ family sporulation protein [Peribacillus glennii]RFU65218.1 YjcZ family sporulation protein [Peribacillus glennii]